MNSPLFYSRTFMSLTPVIIPALIRFLPSRCPQISYKSTSLWKRLITLITVIRFLSSVFLHMQKLHWYGFSSIYEVTTLSKAFVTMVTLIRFFFNMNSLLFHSRTFMSLTPVIIPALIRFLPSRCPQISYKSTSLWKRLITLITVIRFLSSVFLHMQ